VNKWNSTGDYADNELLQGITLYMDIWVTTTHAIPNNGVIELTFVGVNVKDPY